MIFKLLTEHHLEFLSLKEGCTGLSESTHVKMLHCWKSQALAQMIFDLLTPPQEAGPKKIAVAHQIHMNNSHTKFG